MLPTLLLSLLVTAGPEPLVQQALAVNTDLARINHQLVALTHDVAAAGRWADPVVAVEYSSVPWDSWALDRSPMSGVQLKLQQTFPLPGKNTQREGAARYRVAAGRQALAEARVQLAARVRITYWRLALVRQLRQLTVRHVALVHELRGAVEARYEVGAARQQDVLRLALLAARLVDELGDFERQERELVAALNGALERSVTTAVETPPVLPAGASPPTLAAALAAASAKRPEIARMKDEAAAMQAAADSADYERWPDLTVWAGYRLRRAVGLDPGTDFVSIGLALPLPLDLGNQRAEQAASMRARAAGVTAGRATLERRIEVDLEQALAAWQRARTKAATYSRDLIPRAEAVLTASLAAFESDRSSFEALYTARVELIDLERALRRAQADAVLLAAGVQALMGLEEEAG